MTTIQTTERSARTNACPPWCSLHPGHVEYTDIDGSRISWHSTEIANIPDTDRLETIIRLEQHVHQRPDGETLVQPPEVAVYADDLHMIAFPLADILEAIPGAEEVLTAAGLLGQPTL